MNLISADTGKGIKIKKDDILSFEPIITGCILHMKGRVKIEVKNQYAETSVNQKIPSIRCQLELNNAPSKSRRMYNYYVRLRDTNRQGKNNLHKGT